MAAPVADAYQADSGEILYAGRTAPQLSQLGFALQAASPTLSLGLSAPAHLALALETSSPSLALSMKPAATALEALAATLTPGTVTAWSNASLNTVLDNGSRPFAATGLAPGSVTMLDWCNDMEYDPVRKKFWTAGGRAYEQPLNQKAVWFDMEANAWQSQIDPWDGRNGGHIYDATAYAPEFGILFSAMFGGVSHEIYMWDVDTEAYLGSIPRPRATAYGNDKTIVWMPTLGTEGSLIWWNQHTTGAIERFDWASQAWSQLAASSTVAYSAGIGIYVPLADVVLIGTGSVSAGGMAIVHNDGSVTTTANPPTGVFIYPVASTAQGPFLPHPTKASAVMLDQANDRIYAYVVAENTWHDRAALPAELQSFSQIGVTLPDLGCWAFVKHIGDGVNFLSYLLKPDF